MEEVLLDAARERFRLLTAAESETVRKLQTLRREFGDEVAVRVIKEMATETEQKELEPEFVLLSLRTAGIPDGQALTLLSQKFRKKRAKQAFENLDEAHLLCSSHAHMHRVVIRKMEQVEYAGAD